MRPSSQCATTRARVRRAGYRRLVRASGGRGRGCRLLAAGLAATLAAAVAACGDDGGARPAPASAPPSSAPRSDPPPASPAPGPPDLAAPADVVTGIRVPWGLAFLPGGDALLAERNSGRVLQVPAGGGAPREVYRVPGVVAAGEGGLLGLAVAPTYGDDRWVYAYHTASGDNRIVRFRVAGDGAGSPPEVVFAGIDKAGVHNGGRLAFGPDGMLYAGTGDAGSRESSQDPADPNGKILRMTADGKPAPGNPGGSVVYSLGHRNVQGFAWDAGGRMFAVEFGQNRFDEVNLIEPGRNYGWPRVEGQGDTAGGRYTNPLIVWSTDEASPSGAAIAGGTLYVAALAGERLWTVPLTGAGTGTPKAEFVGRYGRLRTVAVAPDGALWLTTSNFDGRGDARAGDDRIIRFPPR
jgi:glucose/arabinose dehydrogenase